MVNMMFRSQIGRNMEVYIDDMLDKSTKRHYAKSTKGFVGDTSGVEHWPTSSSAIERSSKKANHIFLDEIKKRLDWEKKNWADQLLSVLWAYRTSAQTPTGETPFWLAYGTKALTPMEVTQASFRSAVFEASQNKAGLQANTDFIDEVREEALDQNETYKQKV
ncbi:uncharacterized protein LOC122093035 [Macadamia integrifolia]|uniref:uncharacterized protein LOC122093035 n=1 Tax=Macadamia integrifolia TaxID=60698 RepID=UPI001C527FC6|nr:uncharacterized protein LOC122093035 [Macadamia integrifolia]